MVSILSSLKFVQEKRTSGTNSVQMSRNKLLVKLDEQIALANALRAGQTLNIKRTRKERDEMTGVVETIESVKRIKKFWFKSAAGKLCVELLYGYIAVEFKKGLTAIELVDEDQLVTVLEKMKKAVEVGELDAQIANARDAVKAKFRK